MQYKRVSFMNIKLKLLRISVIGRSLECSRIKWYKKYKEGSDYMVLNLKDIIFLILNYGQWKY